MLPEEYEDLNPSELADELAGVDREIDSYQSRLASLRKMLNAKMELREDILDRLRGMSQYRGWQRT